MSLTPYHARYFAEELTKRSSSESIDSLTSALADAQVELNPHQIEASLFAFRSPLSRGAILADEVGLGKTIEAGILLSQRWAERRRRLLVICPANLRKQWSQELEDKFFLPSAILEAKTFNEALKRGNLNPFEQPRIILCSYQFARAKEPYLRQTGWDLVVVDEAHRLRNVYKPANKIANAIKDALADRQKVLLTATPLQNSLLELYGLVSIVDEHIFGDIKSFKAQFSRLNSATLPSEEALARNVKSLNAEPSAENYKALNRILRDTKKAHSDDYSALKLRIRPICQRTLRKQVLQYVSFTNRHALVQEFFPSEDEQRLRDDGQIIDSAACKRLFDLPAEASHPILVTQPPALDEQIGQQQQQVLEEISRRNARWLDQEISKLDRWSEDLKFGLEQEIRDLDKEIRETKRVASAAASLADKLAHQRMLKALQTTRNQKRKDLFVAQDDVEARRDSLIADIEGRMAQGQQLTPVFTIHWRLR